MDNQEGNSVHEEDAERPFTVQWAEEKLREYLTEAEFSSRKSISQSNGQHLHENDGIIMGEGNDITGRRNIIIGQHNKVSGHDNIICGILNQIRGRRNRIYGDYNYVKGVENECEGHGNANRVTNDVIIDDLEDSKYDLLSE